MAINNYARDVEASYRLNLPDNEFTYSDFFQNKMLIIHAIRKGLPYSLFIEIQKLTPFSEEDWADFLNISVKTLQRHKKEEDYYFKPIHTEKIIELAEVTQFGKEVFDSPEQFYSWLNTPSYALANLKPAELLKDSYGKELVMAELNRIEHGIFA
ncbi:antitoxin Xre/MbcA/ParS toxin-binding domain-containing protein [Gillisia limnaea]|uniref:type II RES/Xre toxin-antitoxin system antitoxin n=1 Tax=Gillisia limnaea TaxID=195907 RepID=UPI0002F14B21